MLIVVLADELQRQELMRGTTNADVVWISDAHEFLQRSNADVFLDLTFENTTERKNLLQQLLPKLIIVNSVVNTLSDVGFSFIRINGWNTFLSSSLPEAACNDEVLKKKAEEFFTVFNKQPQWLPDEPGFVAARVVSMIINEAFLGLSEGVSTKDEINTAMKLGTAYPFGPFEWAGKIGLQNVARLLQKLSATQSRYTPAELLMQEAGRS